jgi:hypothetical protein
LTGNNIDLSDELIRRCVRIRIDPGVECAWRRSAFKHKHIEAWAKQHRDELVHAALVLVQAWIASGQPKGEETLGSFENWAEVMGGLLKVIGVPGFLQNVDELRNKNELEGVPWREFTVTWWKAFRTEPARVSTLNDFCQRYGLLESVRGDGSSRAQESRLGRALSSKRDRIYEGLSIRLVVDANHKGRCYALEPTASFAENSAGSENSGPLEVFEKRFPKSYTTNPDEEELDPFADY